VQNGKYAILTKIVKLDAKTAPIGDISRYEAETMSNILF